MKNHDPLKHARAYLQESSLKDPLNIYYYGLLKTFLPDDLLYKNERMASANRIINRTPFIDYRLVQLAFQIPEHMKVTEPSANNDGTKLIYKNSIQGMIPDEILNRKKGRGFSLPASEWFQKKIDGKVFSVLSDKSSLLENLINDKEYKRIYSIFLDKKYGYDRVFKSLFYLKFWNNNIRKFLLI